MAIVIRMSIFGIFFCTSMVCFLLYHEYVTRCLVTTFTGGRDSPKPTSNDGWITTGKGGKNLPIDQNKLRNMAKVISHHPMLLHSILHQLLN